LFGCGLFGVNCLRFEEEEEPGDEEDDTEDGETEE
jgi:hypothetical protein